MSLGVVAGWTQRMAPTQRGQCSRSAWNTCRRSQAQGFLGWGVSSSSRSSAGSSCSGANAKALTTREAEILRMMASGFSNKEIAEACFVAHGTVKNHISNILSKLGVRDRTRAVLRGLQLGVI